MFQRERGDNRQRPRYTDSFDFWWDKRVYKRSR